MDAVLVGMDGPPKGRLVPLGEAEVSLGRDQANAVAIDDLAASRRHCVIRRSDEGFQLTDLNSRNSTFVNGVPVRQRVLEHNDEIRVGGSVFMFLHSRAEPARGDVELEDSAGTSSSTRIRSEDTVYLNPKELGRSLAPSGRTVRGIQVLLRISQALQGAPTLEALERYLLDLLSEAVPAERGAILLSPKRSEFDSTFTWHRNGDVGGSVRVNAAVTKQVLEERVAVLADQEGDAGGPPCHLIAVPLICFERVIGVLYLETRDAKTAFDQGHLELVAAVGSIAGLATHNLLQLESLRSENQRLQEEVWIEHDMVGESDAMREIHRFIGRVVGTSSTVLIGGESGTGKELVARAIHRNSPRANRAFVTINCAALTETLLEDEMFGHERGAFTGAIGLRKGKFEVADGGTLFLDEVGELAPSLQAKLLRVLQHSEFERVGGTRPVHVDVRIIAASNRDLETAVRTGAFRQDLFFRLNVIPVTVPPLRDRREDIPLLAAYFTEKWSQRVKRKVTGISEKARACLLRYDWPGNVRELENAIERAVVLGASDTILPEDLPETVLQAFAVAPSGTPGSYPARQPVALREVEHRAILEALEHTIGDRSATARLLGISRATLYRKLREYQHDLAPRSMD